MAIPRKVQDLLDKMSADIREAVLASVKDIKSRSQIAALTRAIESGRIEDVIKVLNLGNEFFEDIDRALRAAYLEGGIAALNAAMSGFPRTSRLAIKFSGRSVAAERWMTDNSSRLVVEIAATTREAVRSVLTNGLAEGRNPTNIALDLVGRVVGGERAGGVIGLNSQLTGYLESARRELESGDPAQMQNYLTRALRDKRYDSVVRKAMDAAKPVSKDSAGRALSSYSDALLKFRADMIGRTEATAALNASRHEAYAQVVAAGHAKDEDVSRRWRTAGNDGHTRHTHAAMDDQRITGLKEPFVSPSGARMMHPGDTSLGAGPEEIINCRCHEEIKIDFLAMQARLELAG